MSSPFVFLIANRTREILSDCRLAKKTPALRAKVERRRENAKQARKGQGETKWKAKLDFPRSAGNRVRQN